ncbi:MAG TPA: DNA repair protein RecN [Dysgonamonadaceae bacterium]|nr:DNA repair protein RecN [Dysgonamonadaceae bacterium]
MLKSLFIKNYALIDELKVEFDDGFSVLTGETGAGKSIILGALSLILGQRAENRFIKQNENKCTIEGVFDISVYELGSLFEKNDWVYDGDVCIIRREIWASGKSRAFVNDSPVYLQDLKELGERLIDIHSQHENLSLNDNLFQLTLIDSIAKTASVKENYKSYYQSYRKVQKELLDLHQQAQKNKEKQDFLQFQFDSLTEAHLVEDEQEVLEAELETITHSEEIKSSLYKLTNILSEDEESVELGLRKALDAAKSLQRFGSTSSFSQSFAQRIESAYIDMKDLREEAETIFQDVDFDPDRQQIIENRLSVIYGLQQKHSVATVKELLEILADIDLELQGIDSLDYRIEQLEKEFTEKEKSVYAEAELLSKLRKSTVTTIEKNIEEKLKYLGIPNAKFKIQFREKKELDATGKDTINFLFTANKNTDLQPIAQIASGGEISRLMLALKSLVADATALATIIFDEVDTGTSGEIADKMGFIMQEMSNKMQVVAITHLPQIAAKGSAHYYVYKEELTDATATSIKKLTMPERIDEIARMLSGAETTIQALDNARVMLNTIKQ